MTIAMKQLTCLAVVVIGMFSTMARGDEKPCELSRIESADMATLSDGRITVQGAVDEHKIDFLVDTGGMFSTLNPSNADRLSSRHMAREFYQVGGRKMDEYVVGNNFSLGHISGKKFKFLVQQKEEAFEGTLAPDVLSNFDVEMDFAHGKLNFFSPNKCDSGDLIYWTHDRVGAVIPLKLESGHITVPVVIDGKTITAVLDTGANDSVIAMRDADASLSVNEKTPGMKLLATLDEKRNYRRYSYPFQTLSFEGVTVSHPRIRIMSDAYAGKIHGTLILGMDVLRQLRLYIAYKQQKLYVTPALSQ